MDRRVSCEGTKVEVVLGQRAAGLAEAPSPERDQPTLNVSSGRHSNACISFPNRTDMDHYAQSCWSLTGLGFVRGRIGLRVPSKISIRSYQPRRH